MIIALEVRRLRLIILCMEIICITQWLRACPIDALHGIHDLVMGLFSFKVIAIGFDIFVSWPDAFQTS